MSPRVLLLQSRPEASAAAAERLAFARFGGLDPADIEAVRLGDEDATTDPATLDLARYRAVLLGGGPANFAAPRAEWTEADLLFEAQLRVILDEVLATEQPFFGACLGVGALVTHAGGAMSFDAGEAPGATEIALTDAGRRDPLTRGLPERFTAIVGHKEGARAVSEGIEVLATSAVCPQIVKLGERAYATQFHPELDAAGLIERLTIYRAHGYAPEDEVDDLIEGFRGLVVEHAPRILTRFVDEFVRHSA